MWNLELLFPEMNALINIELKPTYSLFKIIFSFIHAVGVDWIGYSMENPIEVAYVWINFYANFCPILSFLIIDQFILLLLFFSL